MDTPNYFVCYADVLGFKNLVLENKVPFPENLEYRDRPRPATVRSLTNFGNRLSKGFTTFHRGVELTPNDIVWTEQVNIYVFSDSLFVATPSWSNCFSFAERLMRYCIGQETPLRMGVGFGSFVSYGFGFEEAPNIKFLSSQFFGTGVVYATEAEKCLKGMRIAMHPSAVNALGTMSPGPDRQRLESYKILPLPPEDFSTTVQCEWSYLGGWNRLQQLASGDDQGEGNADKLLVHIKRMREENKDKDLAIQKQYVDTELAFGRMQTAETSFIAKNRPDS